MTGEGFQLLLKACLPHCPGPGTVSLPWASALDPRKLQRRSHSLQKPAMNARSMASPLGTGHHAVSMRATRYPRGCMEQGQSGDSLKVGRGL